MSKKVKPKSTENTSLVNDEMKLAEDSDNNMKVLFAQLEEKVQLMIEASENKVKQHVDKRFNSIERKIEENKAAINAVTVTANKALDISIETKESFAKFASDITVENENLKNEVETLKELTSVQSIRINVIEKRLEDQTNRSSRKSVVIRGVPEGDGKEKTWDATRKTVCKVLSQYTKIEIEKINDMIERVHRGKSNNVNRSTGTRDIYAAFYDWNDSELIQREFRKHGKGSKIFIDQKYGPDTSFRRHQALQRRKQLKASGTIASGYIKYPAKLMVKYDLEDPNQVYTMYEDFSSLEVPLVRE